MYTFKEVLNVHFSEYLGSNKHTCVKRARLWKQTLPVRPGPFSVCMGLDGFPVGPARLLISGIVDLCCLGSFPTSATHSCDTVLQ